MIDYWMTPDRRMGLVPDAGTLVLPDAAVRHTANSRDDLPEDLRAEYDELRVPVVLPDPATIIAKARRAILAGHAAYLDAATGRATIEERDTWKPKEEAARAYLAGTATDPQTAMIEGEAAGDDTDPIDLADAIVTKADAYMRLIGHAGNSRARALAALAAIPPGATSAEAQAGAQTALATMRAALQG